MTDPARLTDQQPIYPPLFMDEAPEAQIKALEAELRAERATSEKLQKALRRISDGEADPAQIAWDALDG